MRVRVEADKDLTLRQAGPAASTALPTTRYFWDLAVPNLDELDISSGRFAIGTRLVHNGAQRKVYACSQRKRSSRV